jgi:adenylate cyclase
VAEERVQRRLAAILAADVVGYSRLMEQDEAGTLARLKSLRSDLFDARTVKYGGRVFKTTGDGLLIEFPSAVEAVNCAIEVQREAAIAESSVAEDRRIAFRIGISLGDVIVEGDDLYGNGVNVAARLESMAERGGICISSNVRDSVGNTIGVTFDDLGDQQVKNIERPVRTYAVRLEDGASIGSENATSLEQIRVLERPSIAVLPFQNMSGDPEQEYFADGLTEDIISALSAWRSFPVISRNSTFVYKGSAVNVQQVAQDLGVRYVLEGSVRQARKRVRISAQLIAAESDHHLWTEHYDRELEDIFELQDEIAQRIAAIIEPELGKAERNRTMLRQPMNFDAWECYQRATSFLYEFTAQGNVKAREMFERAIQLDLSYSQAYSGLALTHQRDLFLGYAESRDRSLAEFRQAARRAVALDETDSFAHRVIGLFYLWERNFDIAIAHGEKALKLNPSDGISHIQLGIALSYSGNPERGISSIERGLQLNPHDPRQFVYCTYLADACLIANRYDDSIEAARTAVRLRPDFLEPRLVRASALGHLGKFEDAEAELEECRRLNPDFAEPSASWRGYRGPQNLEHLFEGLRKAGWSG